MTYTDEEIVRELEHKYGECALVKQVCERLLEYSEDQTVHIVDCEEE